MEYTKLLEVVDKENHQTVEDYLKYDVILPCLDGHDDCEIDYELDERILVEEGFEKGEFFDLYTYCITNKRETKYEVTLKAHHTDTLPIDGETDFAKTNVALSLRGEVAPDNVDYKGTVFADVAHEI